MEEKKTENYYAGYPVVQLNRSFYDEIRGKKIGNNLRPKVIPTKNPIWEYIPTTNLQLYWANKKTWIYKLTEIKWQSYLLENHFYPESSFREYLLTEKWGADYDPETVDDEIKIWLAIRNTIYQ
ncbi:MAG: hypothetical protein HPY62_04805 [Bacteroidales bacterium]|nr:hypothetical protein [Bacteroidales bacterium]